MKNRNVDRHLRVGLLTSLNDLTDLDDAIHDMDAANLRRSRKEAAQHRDEKRAKRTTGKSEPAAPGNVATSRAPVQGYGWWIE